MDGSMTVVSVHNVNEKLELVWKNGITLPNICIIHSETV
jgi:hypothetical protein